MFERGWHLMAALHWRRNRKRNEPSDGIARIRTFPFPSDSASDSVACEQV